MEHIFWLIENEICGRPGPNHEPWDLEELSNTGVGAILSVNSGYSVCKDDLALNGLRHLCVPLAVSAPPLEGELELCVERLPIAFRFVQDNVKEGKSVLVHCRHGKDRTGLFLAYYLVKSKNMDIHKAIESVKRIRSTAMSAEGWDKFVPEALNEC